MSVSRELVLWARRVRLVRKTVIALAIAAVASALATYAAMRGLPPFGPSRPDMDQLFLLLNLILVLPLCAIVAWRLVQVWAERRRGLAGSRLHVRLVILFSLVAVIPTIVVAVFSYLLFTFGVQAWFSERVRTALSGSLAVAEAYLHEHQQTIRADVVSMASDLNRDAPFLTVNPQRLNQIVAAQAALRSLNEAVVFDADGRILARSGFSLALQLEPVPDWAVRQADSGDVAVNEYKQLEGQRSNFQTAFSLMFVAVGLLLLTGAVLVGLRFATKLARPISSLVAAAEQVRAGDLAARVPEGAADEEFGSLSRAFNRMTHQLQTQQSELIEANRQLDQRRRFTETVLAGVSAGVIGLDQHGRINLPNRSSSLLLGADLDHLIGRQLGEAVPEMAKLLDEATRRPERLAQSQVQVVRRGRSQTLLVRIAAEREGGEVKGYIVTFDDITELLSAQRKAAWADVARRIAHEIKNPLTPIQLSAERLKRKYLKQIQIDPETFTTCTETIIRHVGDIRRHRAAGGVPAAHGDAGDPLRARPARFRAARLRCSPGEPGAGQSAEERRRIDPGARWRGPARHDRRARARGGAADRARRRGQRPRPAAGGARPPRRALCHDARQGHGARPCHRQEDHGRPWRGVDPRGPRRRRRARGAGLQPCRPARHAGARG